jgi:hypothetical protein
MTFAFIRIGRNAWPAPAVTHTPIALTVFVIAAGRDAA